MSSYYVPFSLPDTGEGEAAAARAVILGGWLTTGERCRQFEDAFAARLGARHAVALNSCTAALHLALEAVGVRPGDIVVTTPYTFVATTEVILHLGALPVFVDVDPATANIDCDQLESVIDRLTAGDRNALPPASRSTFQPVKPRAILPVHVAGVPCELERMVEVAAARGIAVVDDAAHAFPSYIGERAIGACVDESVAAATCFSFYATKTITTGEGGMLVTHSDRIAARARQMSLHGMGRDAWTRYRRGGAWWYDVVASGFKYNLSDIAAAIGLVQLERADEMMARRAEIAARYDELVEAFTCLERPGRRAGTTSSWHLYMLRLRVDGLAIGRDRFIDELALRGVGSSVHFIPVHLHSFYKEVLGYRQRDFPAATFEYEREISLPIYSRMSERDVEHVCTSISDIATRFAR